MPAVGANGAGKSNTSKQLPILFQQLLYAVTQITPLLLPNENDTLVVTYPVKLVDPCGTTQLYPVAFGTGGTE